jgi:hypothetical protein
MDSVLPDFIKDALGHMTPAQLRDELSAMYQRNKALRETWFEMTQRAVALNTEYHIKRLKEHLPNVAVEEEILLTTLDARQSPVSLDKALTEMAPGGVPMCPISRIIFDRKELKFYVYGKTK